MVEVLNAIYEEDFLGFSYGFRPGRGQHDALDALAVGIKRQKVNCIVDADIARFFDTVNHDWLIRFVEHRIGDPRIIRLIRKWLKAGVMEDGIVSVSERGTPQGAVISPLLANIYLHYVFDLWAERWRQRQAHGQHDHRALCRRYRGRLRARGRRPALPGGSATTAGGVCVAAAPGQDPTDRVWPLCGETEHERGLGKPETFNFLGFTHICGRTRRRRFQLQRKTRRDRMRAKLQEIKERAATAHAPADPRAGTMAAAGGHGLLCVSRRADQRSALGAFRDHVISLWRRTLRRRSQKTRLVGAHDPAGRRTGCRYRASFIPGRIRFAVKHPRWEPGA